MEKDIIIDDVETADWVERRARFQGYSIPRSTIELILDLQFDYLVEKGVVEFED